VSRGSRLPRWRCRRRIRTWPGAASREQAKASADKARRASAKVALWGFISLLIGAFVASYLGTLGGRHRDQF